MRKVLEKLSKTKCSQWTEFQVCVWFLLFLHRSILVARLASNGQRLSFNAVTALFYLVMVVLGICCAIEQKEKEEGGK